MIFYKKKKKKKLEKEKEQWETNQDVWNQQQTC